MTCPHITATTKEYNACALGLYGGKPSPGTCARCIDRNENTPEFATELFARTEKSHPSSQRKISGCCDSAKNYTDRI
jgi:hypothetical protein